MHPIQEKILKLMETQDVSNLTLREIAVKIGEFGSPQKIKHHLNQLAQKGLIRIDKKNNKIEKIKAGVNKEGSLISLPIYGSANCGEATFFADDHVEGYLKVSEHILGNLIDKIKHLFVLRAVGTSMNRADVSGNAIENGDYVIVDKEVAVPSDGDCVVSVIDGVANIKKIYVDNKNQQFILVSESNQDFPPIYVHRVDLDSYLMAGKVVKVMKQPDELAAWRQAGARDILKDLGPISKGDYDYYENLCLQEAM
ncbi:MAG: hypothetical protein HY569_00885 [Candidatus Magasanikbacteria bacterium]|nr:hypothetical protein [Candidatus Magasanikbacteria bacterium]